MYKLNDVIRSAPILSKFKVNIIDEPLVFYTFITNLSNRIGYLQLYNTLLCVNIICLLTLLHHVLLFVFIVARLFHFYRQVQQVPTNQPSIPQVTCNTFLKMTSISNMLLKGFLVYNIACICPLHHVMMCIACQDLEQLSHFYMKVHHMDERQCG